MSRTTQIGLWAACAISFAMWLMGVDVRITLQIAFGIASATLLLALRNRLKPILMSKVQKMTGEGE